MAELGEEGTPGVVSLEGTACHGSYPSLLQPSCFHSHLVQVKSQVQVLAD